VRNDVLLLSSSSSPPPPSSSSSPSLPPSSRHQRVRFVGTEEAKKRAAGTAADRMARWLFRQLERLRTSASERAAIATSAPRRQRHGEEGTTRILDAGNDGNNGNDEEDWRLWNELCGRMRDALDDCEFGVPTSNARYLVHDAMTKTAAASSSFSRGDALRSPVAQGFVLRCYYAVAAFEIDGEELDGEGLFDLVSRPDQDPFRRRQTRQHHQQEQSDSDRQVENAPAPSPTTKRYVTNKNLKKVLSRIQLLFDATAVVVADADEGNGNNNASAVKSAREFAEELLRATDGWLEEAETVPGSYNFARAVRRVRSFLLENKVHFEPVDDDRAATTTTPTTTTTTTTTAPEVATAFHVMDLLKREYRSSMPEYVHSSDCDPFEPFDDDDDDDDTVIDLESCLEHILMCDDGGLDEEVPQEEEEPVEGLPDLDWAMATATALPLPEAPPPIDAADAGAAAARDCRDGGFRRRRRLRL